MWVTWIVSPCLIECVISLLCSEYYCENSSWPSHLFETWDNPLFCSIYPGNLTDGKKVLFAPFFDLKLLWDRAIFSNFYQIFPLVCLFLPCRSKKDASAKSRGLLSTILRRVCFDTWRSISLRKIKMRQFFWNLRWFQVSAESVSVKLLWFHR